MQLPKQVTYSQNGHQQAPPPPSGAFPVQPPVRPDRTHFPEDDAGFSMRSFLYILSHFQIGGTRLSRWMGWLLVLGALAWSTGWLPGRWWGIAVLLLLWLAMLAGIHFVRRSDYVSFEPMAAPPVEPHPLAPADRLAIHATGLFSVEDRYQRYTWLPGFYRAFATTERALLCLVRQRTLLRVGHWPDEEVGMWYVFFMPETVTRVRWGRLHFGRHPRPSVAVEYEATLPPQGRFSKERTVTETLYLTCDSEEETAILWADLAADIPADRFVQTVPQPKSS